MFITNENAAFKEFSIKDKQYLWSSVQLLFNHSWFYVICEAKSLDTTSTTYFLSMASQISSLSTPTSIIKSVYLVTQNNNQDWELLKINKILKWNINVEGKRISIEAYESDQEGRVIFNDPIVHQAVMTNEEVLYPLQGA